MPHGTRDIEGTHSWDCTTSAISGMSRLDTPYCRFPDHTSLKGLTGVLSHDVCIPIQLPCCACCPSRSGVQEKRKSKKHTSGGYGSGCARPCHDSQSRSRLLRAKKMKLVARGKRASSEQSLSLKGGRRRVNERGGWTVQRSTVNDENTELI